jgi:two-component system CheB/CheR fusion protein
MVADPSGRPEQGLSGKEPSLRILIVEDSRDAAYALALLIRSYTSHEVEIAYTGEDALQMAPKFRPDAVLLDIGLPKMDGFEVAKQMRRMPETAKTLIIAITGHCEPSDMDSSAASGINHHLAKPVEIKHLLSQLARGTAA